MSLPRYKVKELYAVMELRDGEYVQVSAPHGSRETTEERMRRWAGDKFRLVDNTKQQDYKIEEREVLTRILDSFAIPEERIREGQSELARCFKEHDRLIKEKK